MFSKTLLVIWLNALGALAKEELGNDDPAAVSCSAASFDTGKLGLGTGTTVASLTAELQANYTAVNSFYPGTPIEGLSFCQVKIILKHAGDKDETRVEVWLPPTTDGWNGRFQGTGGGGFATGMFDVMLAPAIMQGYAAASTDGGHVGIPFDSIAWAVDMDGNIKWRSLQNHAVQSLYEQVAIGKSITEQYYGTKPHHSYWNGCSQGGRQGYTLAQKYPGLLDGILATAPAIHLTNIAMGDLWPQVIMKEAGLLMSKCERDFFHHKAMEACDMVDGVRDGVIVDPDVCDFDPLHLVGQTFHCDGKDGEVTQAMAEIIGKIEQGPRTPFNHVIWHGLAVGTSTDGLAGSTTSPEGVRTPQPFPISSDFVSRLVVRDPAFNVTNLSYGEYMALWARAAVEYSWLWDADDPDLTRFQEAGAKLITWHGINDPVIPYQNTLQYRERVERIMGGPQKVDDFYRIFLAPGVEHCVGGNGPIPNDPLATLVDWVEKGEAPETMEASMINKDGDLVSRDLCAWPGKLKYMGIGDAKRASSWSCIGGTERPEVEFESAEYASGRAAQIIGGLKDKFEKLGMGVRAGSNS